MNDNASSPSSINSTPGVSAEAISRRAYDLWEQEGRPESRELEHWLRAEQELRAGQQSPLPSPSAKPAGNDDTKPLQGTRAGAAAARDLKPEQKPEAPKRNGSPAVSSSKVATRSAPSSRLK